ncbi:hypothetical protein EV193_105192 [Herbihabitans rhizosphaerae]|uniref:Phytase-like domain-containing protein n=1 Tax=Herbihabitans rhizosphaerae TaxID=1872711 RepID=A0A4Q7KMS2_9PSEU|nr:esterase-like activity of phytase family protein [Herbihabitans rhizosphaerae]RZS37634.1 hypothetical protein EV193_105192 [Herbihabitans rhizosphaerae]
MSIRLAAAALIAATATTLISTGTAAASAPGVRLLGEKVIPHGFQFAGTTVGGLSGIDRDPRTGGYVLISDDRSDKQPARFYTASIGVTANGFDSVELTGTRPFLRPDGSTYPQAGVDPEDIRVDPWAGNYVWSQEGERLVEQGKPPVLIDPSVRSTARDGEHVREIPVPHNEKMSAEQRGPRRNLVLEGLTFAAAGVLVTTAIEGPLLQDGPEATTEHGALSRITVQTRHGHTLAQYAYPQEKIFAPADPPGGFATTGVVAILAVDPLDPTRYLVAERSFVTGKGNKVRIFEIDTRGATNVRDADSLPRDVKPVRKKLIADLADLGLSTVDNVEGMTWGPRLPSGERTLLLVSDDNFAPTQVTQVIALALRR